MVACPESPVWLEMMHQPEAAQKVREQLLGPDRLQDPASTDPEPQEHGLEEPLMSSNDLPEVCHKAFPVLYESPTVKTTSANLLWSIHCPEAFSASCDQPLLMLHMLLFQVTADDLPSLTIADAVAIETRIVRPESTCPHLASQTLVLASPCKQEQASLFHVSASIGRSCQVL